MYSFNIVLCALAVAETRRLPRLMGFLRDATAYFPCALPKPVGARRLHRSNGHCLEPLVVAASGVTVAVGAWELPMLAPSGHWTGERYGLSMVAGYLGFIGCRLTH